MEITLCSAMRRAVPVALALFSPALMALGLGNATVESYLNEPLRARIDLVARPDEDVGSVRAGLASAADFALIGASREAIPVPLRFEVVSAGGSASILVTSTLPVRDPILRLIVEVGWPNGRMLREYTLFLDPPTVAAEAPSPVIDERGGQSTARVASPQTGMDVTREAGAAEPAASTPGALPAEGEYGPVRAGDTLWRIASGWSAGSGLGVNQVMVAIQRRNPQAFINGNINLLKRGAILRMPNVEEVQAITPEAARAEVVEQSQVLARPAISAQQAEPEAEVPLVDEASTAPQSIADDVDTAPEVQLEIVPPSEAEGVESALGTEEAGSAAEASVSTEVLREELARTEEELIGERQENAYLRDRIAELERQVETGTEATVPDAGLAAVEDRLREERLSAQAEAEPETAPPAPAEAVPQVTTSSPPGAATPWYRNVILWVIALLVLAAGLIGWIFSRRASGERIVVAGPGAVAPERGVRGLKDEAEEILRVLEPAQGKAPEAVGATASAPAAEPPAAPVASLRAGTGGHDEAELLDEESSDPEVRLDLARAYIAMGDREAARVILDEVIGHGSEEQQAEARSMLKEL